MKELFFQLLSEYKADVKEAIILLNEKNVRSPYFFREAGKGYLDDEHKIKYEFHGYGCRIEYADDTSVDFDFGFLSGNARGDGFHKGAIYRYVYENKENEQKYTVFNSYKEVEKIVDGLVESGEIIKDSKQELYYLPEDFINPNPIRWIAKPPRRKSGKRVSS